MKSENTIKIENQVRTIDSWTHTIIEDYILFHLSNFIMDLGQDCSSYVSRTSVEDISNINNQKIDFTYFVSLYL